MNAPTPHLPGRSNPLAPAADTAHQDWIVVDDPAGRLRDGGLVGAAEAAQLRARGVCLLPVVHRQLQMGAVGGYFRRAWGGGYPLSKDHPRLQCPMMIHVDSPGRGDQVTVHWRARLLGTAGAPGQLRLGVDTNQGIAIGQLMDATAQDLRALGAPDERGGWTVGGTAAAQMGMRGLLPLGLYGVGPGLRVAWAAASVTIAR